MGNCAEKQKIAEDLQYEEQGRYGKGCLNHGTSVEALRNGKGELQISGNPSSKRLMLGSGVYQGNFYQEVASGRGKLDTDTYSYDGEWKNGKPYGYGEIKFKDGTHYKGYFVDGKPEGKGELVDSENFRYKGSFVNGLFEGYGEASWSNGQKYLGEFKSGMLDGEGEYNWPDGRVYQGGYKKNQRNGRGMVLTADGCKIEACWINGKVDGNVIVLQNRQTVEEGKFISNRFISNREIQV